MKRCSCLALLFYLVIALPPASYALSQSVKVDMLKVKLAEQIQSNDYAQALSTLQKLKETGTKLPASFEFFEGRALFESGQQTASYNIFAHYAETQGNKGEYYQQAIAYLVKAEAAQPWQRTFGGSANDSANAIVQTADGGFAVAGLYQFQRSRWF